MTTVLVTVAVPTRLPPDEAKEHARWLVERTGLAVERATVKPSKTAGRTFIPKAGQPGSTLVRQGRAFQVWSGGPYKGSYFAVPVDPEPGDAPVFLVDDNPRTWPRPLDALGEPYTADAQEAA